MRTLAWTTISLLLVSLPAAAYDVELGWIPASSGATPDGFRVEGMKYGGVWREAGDVSAASAPSLVLPDVPEGSYRYRVAAYNRHGPSAWAYSSWVIVGDPASSPPDLPSDMTVTVSSGSGG